MAALQLIAQSNDLSVYQIPAFLDNYIYLIYCQSSRECIAIDPGDHPALESVLQERQWQLTAIWNTHHHSDHVGGNIALQQRYRCAIYGLAKDAARLPGINVLLEDGQSWELGDSLVECHAIPGHTSQHCFYFIPGLQVAFVGDTLFGLGCGRMMEGTPEQYWQSLQTLRNLPKETKICCAHEYTLANAEYALSLKPYALGLMSYVAELQSLRRQGLPTVPSPLSAELAYNPFLQADRLEMQKALGLEGQSAPVVFAFLRKGKDLFPAKS